MMPPTFFRRLLLRRFGREMPNPRALQWLRGLWRGKRCFVIGNGPSLRVADLERISAAGYHTIASNKIYLCFEETQWRPDFYTVADWCVAENNQDVIRELPLLKLFPYELEKYFSSDKNAQGRSIFYRQFVPERVNDQDYGSYFFDDFCDQAFVGETITNLNIQLALYLGAKEVYLLGIDGKYQSSNRTSPHPHYQEVFVSDGEINHFHPNYRKPGETWSIPRPEAHERNYTKCLSELRKRGVTLANATPGTAVKSLPLIDLEDLI
ncbi:DUF115 domain-containing protein [Opitutaceae bacterium]|nr:DUF115 domain-containing protein [Opitutaceae bacterium]MDB4474192.1 DUF115 domain-containing protein [Opitutaceae bacterium]